MKNLRLAVGSIVFLLLLCASLAEGRQKPRVFMTDNVRSRAYLGVQIQDVTRKFAKENHLPVNSGAYVSEVIDDSPAEEAGIREGDVIVKMNGKAIEDSYDLTQEVERAKPKSSVKLEVVRGESHKELTATLSRTPRGYGYFYNFGDLPRVPRAPFHFNFSWGNTIGGLEVQELSRQLADFFEVPNRRGLLVASVVDGSSAARAGFKAGDVLTEFDGGRIADISDLHEAIGQADSDRDVQCMVIRKGKGVKITWHVESPEDEEDISCDIVHPPRVRLHPHDHFMDRLREELNELGTKLRKEFRNLKDSFRSELLSS